MRYSEVMLLQNDVGDYLMEAYTKVHDFSDTKNVKHLHGQMKGLRGKIGNEQGDREGKAIQDSINKVEQYYKSMKTDQLFTKLFKTLSAIGGATAFTSAVVGDSSGNSARALTALSTAVAISSLIATKCTEKKSSLEFQRYLISIKNAKDEVKHKVDHWDDYGMGDIGSDSKYVKNKLQRLYNNLVKMQESCERGIAARDTINSEK